MKIKRWFMPLCAAAALLVSPAGHAGLVVSTVGDANGFGVDPSLQPGDVFDSFFVPAFDPAEGVVTDRVIAQTFTLMHLYSFSGTVSSASLELFSAGWGLYGLASLYVNGVHVGELSAGEVGALEYVRQDLFDLTPLLTQISLRGSDSVQIRVVGGPGAELDAGALDYSRLTVVTDAGPSGGNAPEPASPVLIALALLGAFAARRTCQSMSPA